MPNVGSVEFATILAVICIFSLVPIALIGVLIWGMRRLQERLDMMEQSLNEAQALLRELRGEVEDTSGLTEAMESDE